MDITTVIAKYIGLRDRKAEIAKRHAEELKPLNEAQEVIENVFLDLMNQQNVNSFKTDAGTAYKATATSCQMADPVEFKKFVFEPAIRGVINHLICLGVDPQSAEQFRHGIVDVLLTMPMWDMIDFRAGKKGITEYMANENLPVPGININTVSTVQIRRS